MVTNADKYKHFERWATASEFPVINILNDGTTSHEARLGALADIELCLRVKNIVDEEVLVIAGDMMFQVIIEMKLDFLFGDIFRARNNLVFFCLG